jgi:hypothetical protein
MLAEAMEESGLAPMYMNIGWEILKDEWDEGKLSARKLADKMMEAAARRQAGVMSLSVLNGAAGRLAVGAGLGAQGGGVASAGGQASSGGALRRPADCWFCGSSQHKVVECHLNTLRWSYVYIRDLMKQRNWTAQQVLEEMRRLQQQGQQGQGAPMGLGWRG